MSLISSFTQALRPSVFLLGLMAVLSVNAQDKGFPFGKTTTYAELKNNAYAADTSAVAVVLQEFGEAYIDNGGDHNLLLDYHVKIKILKKAGLERADVHVPLYKNDDRVERIRDVKASSFTFEGGTMREVPLNVKNVYSESVNKYWNVSKFAIPNVQVGSVIEYRYVLESPFIFNFRNWTFQGEIPKVQSEYWATIPANYKYNIILKGTQKLDKNDTEVIRDCFAVGGGRADCGRYKWLMKNIPAFKEEEYMTAKSNFMSGISFELAEVEYFDGRKTQYTKEWKDAEDDMRREERFGLQLKRGRDIAEDHVELLMLGEQDTLVKAKKIYDFIKFWYRWDEVDGKYSEFGIKKAFDKKAGNVGDINLTLIAALRQAGVKVEPVMLSTRENGWATELHPVLSDFNYVIAKANIGKKVYLLDATDDLLPFGLIPERCLNGKGRVLGEEESYWYELKASEKSKQTVLFTLNIGNNGDAKGTIVMNHTGYRAVHKRRAIMKATSQKDFITSLSTTFPDVEVTGFTIENLEDLSKPLIIKLDVNMALFQEGAPGFLFDPFFVTRYKDNPFKSAERQYPVDFGVSMEDILIVNLTYPEAFEPVDLPEKVGLALPNAGGRYLFNTLPQGHTLSLNNSLLIGRTLFSSEEYHYLRELYARVIAVQQTNLVFKRKGT